MVLMVEAMMNTMTIMMAVDLDQIYLEEECPEHNSRGSPYKATENDIHNIFHYSTF
jgi:hypothetical protein